MSCFPFLPSKLARLSQKYPKAPFPELVKMVHDLKDAYHECCEGDMVECVDDWVSSPFQNNVCIAYNSVINKGKESRGKNAAIFSRVLLSH